MAKAPSAAKDGKDKKSRSSAAELRNGKAGKTDFKQSSSRPEDSAVPVKSVLKESKPAVQANNVEQDFPRGAAPRAPSAPKTKTAQPAEERGLFDDGLQASASTDAAAAGAKKRRADGSNADATATSSGKPVKKKRKMINKNDKKLAFSSSSSTAAGANQGDTFRVEHMSYKRLVPGPTVLLVQIIAILPLELIVSMPNQLLGHVPITNISKVYTKRLEEDLEQSSDEEEEAEESGSEDENATSSSKLPSLSDMFHPGQYVLASVVTLLPPRATTSLIQSMGGRSQRGNEDWKASRRCELSLEPERVNAGITKSDLKNGGICLQGTVKSVEDNGYVLSFGVASASGDSSADSGLTAFVGFKEEKKGKKDAAAGAGVTGSMWPKSRMTLGGIVTAKVLKVAENGRTASVSLFPKDVPQVQLTTPPSITSILPGTLVQATISAITPSGLNLKFLGFFEGTVDSFHLPSNSTSAYKLNQKVLARTLWTSPPTNDSPIRFALSLLPHIISLTPKSAPLEPGNPESEKAPINQVLPIGTFIENLEITKIDAEWGLLCSLPGTDLKAFVHISHVSDEHTTNLNTGTGGQRWKVGTDGHKGRVIGYSAFDGLLQVSMQQSVLERKFMKVADLQIGEVLEGNVQRLSDSALFVNIHGSVAGIVWPLHYSDLRLKHPERKFKPGSAVKTRVLSLDSEKNRVVLTLKRSLVNSDLPVLQSIAESEVGQVLQATVHTFLKKDMLVELFGGMRAFVPIAEAADKFVADIKKEFTIGQVLKVRVTAVDLEMGRLTASVKQALDSYKPKETKDKTAKKGKAKEEVAIADISGIEVGAKVTGDIAEIHENQVVLALEGLQGVKALLSLASLARHRSTTADELRTELKTGETLVDLVVVTKNPEKGLVILGHPVTASSSLFGAAAAPSRTGISANTLPTLTFDDLQEGQIIDGTMGDQNPQGYFVQLAKGIRGKIRWTELADDYDSVQGASFARGTSVNVIVIDYDKASKRIDLSMRASRIQSNAEDDEEEDAEVKDPVIESIEDLEDGKEIRGFVRSVSDAGVFVDIGKDLAARVQIKELFDEFVKNWKPRFTVGQLVSGKILSTNKAKKQIEMTFRKNASAKRTKKDTEPTVTFEGLSDGQVVKGIIKRVENYGAFIRIQGSTISGLCYKNQFSDDPKEDWTQLVNVGDLVKAVIIELDMEKRKISFSMKPSLLPDGDVEDEENDDYKQKLNKLVELQEAADEESDAEDDSDDDLQIVMDEEGAEALGSDEEEDEDEVAREADESFTATAVPVAPVASTSKAPLKLSAFKWDGQVADSMDVDDQEGEAGSDNESEDSEAEAALRAKKGNKNGILVDDKTGELANQLPTSASDYDRLLLASPSSSYIWIQYMSHFLQLSDTERARQIGQRALKTINYREEEERLNVWIAIINLENTFGDETSLDDIVNKAIQNNDPKKVYLRTLEVFETTAKYEKEQELFERFVKKFNTSSKAWTLYGQFLLNRGRSTEARDLLPRSLKSLPKRKHVKTISQFALMEFKSGEAERGRTIFEGIVDTYPKRLDLWWIYIDQEIRLRNTAGVRALFDRVLATKLSSKKTKSLLKKWLAFEKQHGDDAGAEAVKQRAIAYVEQLQN